VNRLAYFENEMAFPSFRLTEGASILLAHQLRQLGDIAGDPSRLILAEQLGCGASPRPIDNGSRSFGGTRLFV